MINKHITSRLFTIYGNALVSVKEVTLY